MELDGFDSYPIWFYHSRKGTRNFLILFVDFEKRRFSFLTHSLGSGGDAVPKFIRGVCPSPRQRRIRIPNEPIMNMLSSY